MMPFPGILAFSLFGLILGGILASRPLLLLGFFGLAFAGTTMLWHRYCLYGVSFRRSVTTRKLFPGETTDVEYEITNEKPLPLSWLHVEEEVSEALSIESEAEHHAYLPGRRKLTMLFSLRWFERVRRRIRLRADRRGVWKLGPALMRSGDVFGLTLRRRRVETETEVLVYPRLVPLADLGLPARNPFGDLRSRRWILTDPLRAVASREYQSGDDARFLDWKATARRQRLHSRVFEATSSPNVVLVLDVSGPASERFTRADADSGERAIETCAALAYWAWERGVGVGFLANAAVVGRDGLARLAPSTHPDQLSRVLEALARITLEKVSDPMRLLETIPRTVRYGATIVLVTVHRGPGTIESLVHLRRRGFEAACVDFAVEPLAAVPEALRYIHPRSLVARNAHTPDRPARRTMHEGVPW